MRFVAGSALALGAHEGGHLVFDQAFGARPRVSRVNYGPVPFFAITHRSGLSPRREFTIDSAGFWVQSATNEWILTRRRYIRREHAPLAKGMLAFNVLLSVGYAATAFAGTGPFERDTRGMAAAIRINERAIGAVVLAPAVLDAYRYFRPDVRWARWASRVTKIGSVALVAK